MGISNRVYHGYVYFNVNCKIPLLIKIVNCLFSAGIVLFIYLIAKEFTSEKAAKIVSCCYMILPFPLLFNTVLSNQHISSFMFLLAIWILISKKY